MSEKKTVPTPPQVVPNGYQPKPSTPVGSNIRGVYQPAPSPGPTSTPPSKK